MLKLIDHWNVNITPSDGSVVTVIKACEEPKIEGGFLLVKYHDYGVTHQEGFNLSEVTKYSISPSERVPIPGEGVTISNISVHVRHG